MMTLNTLIEQAKTTLDLTESADQKSLYVLANRLLEMPEISWDEWRKIARQAPLEVKMAVKLAESKTFLRANQQALKIGVVFAMWGEENRLRPKSASNPNGEDALRVKIEQLDWATRDTQISWHLYAVDDGCPKWPTG
jgi:hypothetical protein